MRILHVTHQFAPETHGGLETYVLDVARAQREAGHDVHIVSGTMAPRDAVETATDDLDGIPITRIHRDDLYFDSWDKGFHPVVGDVFMSTVAEWQADVVHLHHWIRLSQDLGVRLREAGIPHVVTLHDLATSCPRCFRLDRDGENCFLPMTVDNCLPCVPRRPWDDDEMVSAELDLFARNYRAELAGAAAVLTASETVRDLVVASLGLPEDRFTMLPLADQPKFGQVDHQASLVPPLRVGFWGSITERKGVDLIIDAVGRVGRDIEAHIFGAFDLEAYEATLKQQAAGLPIHFHGRYAFEDIPAAGLHVACFPSRCIETYGLVLDEAFELGIPVVVPDIGALAERSLGAGLRFRVGDGSDLASRLEELIADPTRLDVRRAAIPERGSSMEAHTSRLASIYEAACAGPAAVDFEPVSASDRIAHMQRRGEHLFRNLVEREGPE